MSIDVSDVPPELFNMFGDLALQRKHDELTVFSYNTETGAAGFVNISSRHCPNEGYGWLSIGCKVDIETGAVPRSFHENGFLIATYDDARPELSELLGDVSRIGNTFLPLPGITHLESCMKRWSDDSSPAPGHIQPSFCMSWPTKHRSSSRFPSTTSTGRRRI